MFEICCTPENVKNNLSDLLNSLVYKSLWDILLFAFMSVRHNTKRLSDIWYYARNMAHSTFKNIFFSPFISTVSAMLRLSINIHFKSVDHFSKHRLFSDKTDLLCPDAAKYLAEIKCLHNQ